MRVWWDRKEAEVHQTVSQLVGSWGGLEVQGISVRLWEPSVKNPNHFLSLLLPSHSLLLPSLSITTSAFFLLCHTPSSLFPTYFSLMHQKRLQFSLQLAVLKGHASFSYITTVAINWFFKEQQQSWTCSDLSETVGHMGKLNLLPDVTG